MLSLTSPIPKICISPAPLEKSPVEPYSPFTPASFASSANSDGSFRAQHLTPPPTLSSFGRGLSPRRSTHPPKGLERVQFEALLQVSRDKNILNSKKEQDLRREIALKAHMNKQLDRRALFLSKVLAPPSPTAVDTPKTPPESPAIFHYSLPSPGMESPLSLFELMASGDSINDGFGLTCEPWVEKVDFRLPEDQWTSKKFVKPKLAKLIPSLDEISARLNPSRSSSPPLPLDADKRPQSSTRLPAFLRNSAQQPVSVAAKERPNIAIGMDILQMPSRDIQSSALNGAITAPLQFVPRKSPGSPQTAKLQTATMSPHSLSKTNPLVLNETREQISKDMVSALKRRSMTIECPVSPQDDSSEDRKSRRRSSPAELPPLERAGFEHPVLALRGGF